MKSWRCLRLTLGLVNWALLVRRSLLVAGCKLLLGLTEDSSLIPWVVYKEAC